MGEGVKEQYVNPFLVPAKQVWEKMLGCALDVKRYFPTTNLVTTEDITAVIRIKGPLFMGDVLYGFDTETAMSVASVMLRKNVEDLDEVALSALGELVNIISGNAATLLATAGYENRINPPLIIQFKGSRVISKKTKQIQVIFTSALGNLHVRIALYDSRGRSLALGWLQQAYSEQTHKSDEQRVGSSFDPDM